MRLRGPTGQSSDQADLEGRLFADRGPRRGPILWGHFPPVMNVFGTPEAAGVPIGTAYPQGLAYLGGRPAKTFRLVMRHGELDGLYVCEEREFVLIRESPAEEFDREC